MSGIQPQVRPRGASEYISHCKLCRFGIFKDQKRVWRSATPLGWVHVECQSSESPYLDR